MPLWLLIPLVFALIVALAYLKGSWIDLERKERGL